MTEIPLPNPAEQETGNTLESLIAEYEVRKRQNVPKHPAALGTVWWDARAQKLYVCNGMINGNPIWTRVN